MSVSGPKSAYQSGPAAWVVILGLVLAAFCAPVSAVTVSGLYSVEVPVTGSSPNELAVGYADGLARVFVRVSGTRDVLDKEGVEAVLADAESLLLSYQYLRGENGDNRLRMAFGAVGVNRALASINAPVWGANRPLTLAWVAVEDRGSRSLITESPDSGGSDSQQTSSTWQRAFDQAALDRGLPVALPPATFSGDRELLSDLWGQFVNRIRGVSGDIEHDVMALVRVNRSGGQWRAGWVFDGMSMDGGEESVTAPTPEALAQTVVNRWAERYANRYAVAAGEVGESPQVDIVLRGVSALEDYGKINDVLEGLTPVVSVGATRVKGDQLTLRVAFSGELDQLKEYIALDPRFVAIEGEPSGPEVASPESAEAEMVLGPAATEVEPPVRPETENVPEGSAEAEPGDAEAEGNQSMFSYQPVPVDEKEAEQAFESLYQVLYYRWETTPVIGKGDGQ
ncbi:DUF2066 domain-containing protein [Marinobacter sp. F4206]|uniref:DUF2066 domain-containing protein n=1 Tax=Marinobacter sp. F4206 TaxID=2861777 RepID=UPI001C604161|nr:DUF2066 domain-containing protein [Marinobacter sp. F4206]MBW4936612.1 DUF2066 domain-containing protein [Marinobacter sp. F4206]